MDLKIANEQLQDTIDYRRSDMYLEELARTELGYIQDGEIVIRLIDPTPTP